MGELLERFDLPLAGVEAGQAHLSASPKALVHRRQSLRLSSAQESSLPIPSLRMTIALKPRGRCHVDPLCNVSPGRASLSHSCGLVDGDTHSPLVSWSDKNLCVQRGLPHYRFPSHLLLAFHSHGQRHNRLLVFARNAALFFLHKSALLFSLYTAAPAVVL